MPPEKKHLPFKQTGITTIFSFRIQSCTGSCLDSFGWQNPCSGCNNGINLVVVVEYTFFQLCCNIEQSSKESEEAM